MACYSVILKEKNKQLRVFQYDALSRNDYLRALEKALHFAINNHLNGYSCTVERFHLCDDIGILIFDSDSVKM